MLLELLFDEGHRQLGRVDRRAQLLEHVRDRPDVILMAVGDDKAFHFVGVLLEIRDVGTDKIDPEHVVFRKRKTTIDDYDTVAVLKGCHVHPDAVEPA